MRREAGGTDVAHPRQSRSRDVGEVSIEVQLRDGRGKAASRRMRAAGRIPAVVYGHGNDPVALSVDPIQLERKIKASHAGMNTLFDLVGEGSVSGRTVLLKDLQREPVRGALMHADFYEIDANEAIQVSVPIHLKGEAKGVVIGGGVIEHTLREVELSCLPGVIPDELVIDVSDLDVGDSLHVSDLPLPTGVEMVTDEAQAVVSVMIPKVAEEPAEAAEGEAEAEAPAEGAEAEGEESKAAEGDDED
jgi:large subunit ribosomal protein L25